MNGILFTVKRTGFQSRFKHFFRDYCVLHHGTVRTEISIQNGNTSVCSKWLVKGTDHVFSFQTYLCQISVALIVKSVFLQVLQIFSQGLTCNGHHIQMKHILDLFHDRRNSSCIVEELCRPFSCRTDIQQVMGSSVQSVKSIAVNFNTKFMGNGRQMKKRIGRAGNCCMYHYSVFKRFHGYDLVRSQVMKSQPYGLFAGFSCHFS